MFRPTTPMLALMLVAMMGLSGCGDGEDSATVAGLRLGYTPAQCRARFDADAGEFTYVTGDEDAVLEWRPSVADGAEIRSADLEFHLGLLVAVRLELAATAALADGEALSIRDGSILSRESSGDRVTLTWLSRSCPTHADEVRRRLSGVSP